MYNIYLKGNSANLETPKGSGGYKAQLIIK